MRALAADLLGVDARGLVAVVAVGDQQLGVCGDAPDLLDRAGVADAPERFTVPSASVGSPQGSRRAAGRAPPRRAAGSENRAKIGDRFACVARVSRSRSSLGPGCVRSCGRIRPGPYSSTRTRARKPLPRSDLPVRTGVTLLERPQRRLLVRERHPVAASLSCCAADSYGSVAHRRSMRTTLYGDLRLQLDALVGVDHVVGRGDNVL